MLDIMRIDPHTHSTASDGRTPPSRLLFEARDAGLDMIGLADHDTIGGWEGAAASVAPSGVALIRGIEMSTKCHGASVHILGYLFNPHDEVITAHIAKVRSARVERAKEMVARLAKDFPITWDDVVAHAAPGATIGRPHIADTLVDAGVIPDRSAAFTSLLRPGSPYFVPHYAPSASDAVAWITAAGGKAVFAHPRAPQRGREAPERAFDELAEAGLFGLEIDHRDNRRDAIAFLEATALRLHLARFGSSDYHGSGKPNRLGENTTSPRVISALTQSSFLEVLHP
ncbi:MAG: PHP domain-containing protein [Ancrocorticia sp.]|jgi:predicted metal-dependent phosphoesterase TrpH|nr:PHP domain-containing protein [Ancrocorticia sp.]